MSLHSAAGTQLACRRGADSITLTGTVGSTIFSSTGERGLVEEVRSRDFIVRACDYAFAGEPSEPLRGDLIDELVDGRTFTYEVLPIVRGAQPFRYSDTSRTILRIHTREVS